MDNWTKLNRWLLVLICLAAYYEGYLWQSSNVPRPKLELIDSPDRLLNYGQFRAEYGDFLGQLTPIENIRREMSFIGDLLLVGQINIAYSLGIGTFLAQQSPIKSDRLPEELVDQPLIGDRLLDILHTSQDDNNVNMSSELPIGAGVAAAGLEKKGLIGRLFGRGKNGVKYEVPNEPLDQQTDPSRITHIDADLRSCLGPSGNQKSCNACYAFSWLGYVEWHYCKQAGGKLIDFSEQHIIDCGYFTKLQGCKQGYLKSVRMFSHMFGLYLDDKYPFKNEQGACDEDTIYGDIQLKTTDYRRLEVDREQWEDVLEEQPILVEVHLPSDILSYSRGIHPGHNCDRTKAHGMVLVGHGRQEGKPYWLLRNSLGPNWGEGGYFRLARDLPVMDKCLRTGFITRLKFSDLDEDDHEQFYDSLKFEPRLWATKTTGENLLDATKSGNNDEGGELLAS